MFGLSTGEMVVIAILALLVVGPERLPRLMRTLGQYYGQIRRSADDLRRAFVLEADRQDADERYRALKERRAREEAEKQAAAAALLPEDPAPPAEAAPAEVVEEAEEIAANDIPPDAPHPSLDRRKA
jgi:sec-independent protein translocase protein TatB